MMIAPSMNACARDGRKIDMNDTGTTDYNNSDNGDDDNNYHSI